MFRVGTCAKDSGLHKQNWIVEKAKGEEKRVQGVPANSKTIGSLLMAPRVMGRLGRLGLGGGKNVGIKLGGKFVGTAA